MQVADFFDKHRFSSEIDVNSLLSEFDRQMTAGLAGNIDSLAMIPAFVDVNKPVPTEKPIIVLDAGGTNLRVAVMTFNGVGQVDTANFQKFPMPGTTGETIGKTAFFDAFAAFLQPVSSYADTVGFCFSYATEITPELDGKLLRWTKQIAAPEIVGEMVGSSIAAALEQKTGRKLKIRVLNDTVATLLAGKSAGISRQYDSYVGFILGTGTNIAYIESNRAITKVNGLNPNHTMVINVESGNFNGAPASDFDNRFDASTADPGIGRFEKMISGAYIGGLGLSLLKCAAQDGLFSQKASTALLAMNNLETKDFDDFVANPFASEGALARIPFTNDDRRTVIALGEPLFIRAASLTATNIAAAVMRSGAGRDALHPVCITIDGSTYYRTRSAFFKSRTEAALRAILSPRGVHFDIINVDDAPMVGSAVAGLIA